MAKKQKADKRGAADDGAFDSTLSGQVKASAQQIWLAGMGAFARAQAEGTKVFESLVKDGGALQKKTQAAAGDKLADVASRMSSFAGEMQAKAGQQWGKFEGLFDERTATALKRLGVPSAADLRALAARVDALDERLAGATAHAPAQRASREMTRIDELSARTLGTATAKKPAAKTATAKKAAAKKTAAKKAAAAAPSKRPGTREMALTRR
jgi:poly(hydroxyalkanoate) granule-associated protein